MSGAMVPRHVRVASLGGFAGPLAADVAEALASAAAQPPPMSAVMLQPLGGAVARTRPEFLARFAADGFAEPVGRFTWAVPSASPHRATLS